MKLTLISDTHGKFFNLPTDTDLILHAGDVCPNFGRLKDIAAQPNWLDFHFRAWREYHSAPLIGTWGNHDFAPQALEMPCISNTTFGINEIIDINGLGIYCTPYSLPFYSWAFMATEDRLAKMFENVPDDIDIIISHGPPLDAGDECADGFHAGSKALRDLIERIQPKLVVCGHIHEAHGEYSIGSTRVINASSVDLGYNVRESPFTEVDL